MSAVAFLGATKHGLDACFTTAEPSPTDADNREP
jgi:hypothetical protein